MLSSLNFLCMKDIFVWNEPGILRLQACGCWFLPMSFIESGACFLFYFFSPGKFMHKICIWMEGERDNITAWFQLTWCLAHRFLTFYSSFSWLNLFLTFHFNFSIGIFIRSDGFSMAESLIPLSIYSNGRMNWSAWSTVEEGQQHTR